MEKATVEQQVNPSETTKLSDLNWLTGTKRAGVNSKPIKPLKLPVFSYQAPIAPPAPAAVPPPELHPQQVSLSDAAPDEPIAAPDEPIALSDTPQVAEPDAVPVVHPAPPLTGRRVMQLALTRLKRKQWSWTLVWVCSLCVFGGMGTSAFLWLASLPPLPNCKQVSPASVGVQRFYCAQEIARSGQLSDLEAGVTLLDGWSAEQPLYEEAQRSIHEWSSLILIRARERMGQSDLDGAVAIANKIPKSSPVYKEAQTEIAHWQDQWQQGKTIYAKALAAMKAQNWREASYLVADLGQIDHDYWRLQQADVLSKQIALEKQSRLFLTQAQKLVKSGSADDMGQAIALVQQVAPKTQVWAEAQASLQEWSQSLIATGLQQWYKGDVAAAVAIAQQIPPNQTLSSEATDLVQFGYADQQVKASQSQWEPSWGQLWQLWEAIAVVNQIAPNSPIYSQAQVNNQGWQMQFQDLLQLQFANLLAHLDTSDSLQSAIAQATQITPNSARRIQAQTLAAYWKTQMEQLADRPYLTRAQAFAQSGTIDDLKQAIAQAKVIPNNRAAAAEAKTLIDQWTGQIQTIEDQPTWTQAQALAKQKRLSEAIEVARKIQPNRALYEQAQAAIERWQTAIQDAEIAEDRPIMEKANGLAGNGRLTMAIETASQIEPGRALYGEAQDSIKIWAEQRDSIWADRSRSPEESSPEPADRGTAAESPAPAADSSPHDSGSNSSGGASPDASAGEQPSDSSTANQ